MNRRISTLVGLSAVAMLAMGSSSLAAEESKPPMHMHKSDMTHSTDAEVAAVYKSEATTLRETAKSHRDLATSYRARGSGKTNYSQIAEHCDKLAKLYEEAAKEADTVSSGLNK
ncbi:MAG TPA: hypothetical protein VIT67_04655 [Povalibacter sp.]|jgi:hypothetical protein